MEQNTRPLMHLKCTQNQPYSSPLYITVGAVRMYLAQLKCTGKPVAHLFIVPYGISCTYLAQLKCTGKPAHTTPL